MTRETTLARGRAFLEGALIDTCLIDRQTGASTNPTTGAVTPIYTTVYAGRCEVKQGGGASAGQTEVAEATLRLGSYDIKLPIDDALDVRPDDRVTITAARNDTDLVGRKFFLTGEAHATAKTGRRIAMTEIES
jgi:hypothetical protein